MVSPDLHDGGPDLHDGGASERVVRRFSPVAAPLNALSVRFDPRAEPICPLSVPRSPRAGPLSPLTVRWGALTVPLCALSLPRRPLSLRRGPWPSLEGRWPYRFVKWPRLEAKWPDRYGEWPHRSGEWPDRSGQGLDDWVNGGTDLAFHGTSMAIRCHLVALIGARRAMATRMESGGATSIEFRPSAARIGRAAAAIRPAERGAIPLWQHTDHEYCWTPIVMTASPVWPRFWNRRARHDRSRRLRSRSHHRVAWRGDPAADERRAVRRIRAESIHCERLSSDDTGQRKIS
jgi:hypothetical protein